MRYTDYCSRCKSKDAPLIKHHKSATTQYHWCRECNRIAKTKWYATPSGKLSIQASRRRAEEKFRLKVNARASLNQAIKHGKIIKPQNCSSCDSTGRIEGHHNDYTKPFDVIWLCSGCHADSHKSKMSNNVQMLIMK